MSTPVSSQQNTSTLIIGPTGSGKSALLATVAEYGWETFKCVSSLYTSDLGGYPSRVEALIRMGIIWPFRLRTRGIDLSFETMHLAGLGYWPARMRDKMTGTVDHGVPMVAPVTTVYIQTCGTCGTEIKRTQHRQLLKNNSCKTCNKTVQQRDTVITTEAYPTAGLENRRICLFDSLTSGSEWYLQDLAHRKELAGEIGAIGGTVESGDLVFKGNNRAQVGFAQTRILELVSNSLAIPNQVIMPVWTALAHETTDQSGRLAVVGPKLAGDAKTESAPAWFGNSFEAAVVEGERAGEKIRRLYLAEFIDAEGRKHLLKHRADPRFMPEYLEDPPYSANQPPSDEGLHSEFSLKKAFTLLDTALERSMQDLQAKYAGAPGIESVPESFSSSVAVEDAPAAAPKPAAAAPRPGGVKRAPARMPTRKAATPEAAAPAVAEPEAAEPAQGEPEAEAEPTVDTPAEPAQAEPPAGEDVPAEPAQAEPTVAPVQAAAPAIPRPAPPARAGKGWAPPPGTRPVTRAMPPVRRPQALP